MSDLFVGGTVVVGEAIEFVPGPPGTDGTDGAQGPPGPPLTLTGSDTWTAIDAIVAPVAGELWVLTADDTGAPSWPGRVSPVGGVAGDALAYDGASWANVGPFQGPPGDTGPPGSAGAPGTDGTDGTDGTNADPADVVELLETTADKWGDFGDGGTPTTADFVAGADVAAPDVPVRWTVGALSTLIQAALIDGSPGTLDTLNELAAALGDDPNFAATMTTALAGKVNDTGDTITGTTIVQTTFGGVTGKIEIGSMTDFVGPVIQFWTNLATSTYPAIVIGWNLILGPVVLMGQGAAAPAIGFAQIGTAVWSLGDHVIANAPTGATSAARLDTAQTVAWAFAQIYA